MRLTELGETFPILGSGLPRAEGLHLTDVITYILDTINPRIGGGFDDIELTAEVGFMWEDLLSLVLGNRLGKRLNDIQCDGIYCNPDGLGFDPLNLNEVALEEYKCTWKSMKKLPTEVLKWMMQVKGYCHALGLKVVIFHVLYLMGDYFKEHHGPQARSFRIEFTEEEIEENWNVILANKDAAWEAKLKR